MRASWMVLPIAALVSMAAPTRSFAQSQDDARKFRERESAVWESVKNKELRSIRKVFSPNYVGVYDTGITTLTEELDGIPKMTLRSYTLSDFTVRRLDGLNVLVVYKAVLDGDMAGQSMSGTYNLSTLWHRVGNGWTVAAHTEVKAK